MKAPAGTDETNYHLLPHLRERRRLVRPVVRQAGRSEAERPPRAAARKDRK